LTQLYLALRAPQSLSDFEADLTDLKKVEHREIPEAIYYYSSDQSIAYKTYIDIGGEVRVVSISIRPGKGKESLRCSR
jgi:hypothetical protein